ncbi:MAG: acetylxylan esterase, partial [Armatimonadetes bacterium]|nr:acetylxylan esterase [Armatimonadota bacterium]
MAGQKRYLEPMRYMWDLYDATEPSLAFRAENEQQWRSWRRRLKAKFKQLLGGLDEPRCELAPEVTQRRQMDGYTREHVLFQSRPNMTVAAWVLIPDGCDGPTPTMICLQGHGSGKNDIVGIDDDGNQRAEYGGYQNDFAVQAAHRGFFVIAPDMFSFGERRDPEEIEKGVRASSCRRPSMAGILLGRTVPGIRVYDVMRCIDYLQTRPECDPKRIGCMGISGGGTITTFAAAVEERIAAAFISGYLSHWRDSIMPLH